MKKIRFLLLALVLTLGLGLTAGAADGDILVRLDGEALAFADAAPQVREGRVFLPCRTVFEAMGATVGAEGNTVTATRGDVSLTMTLGGTTATVKTGGKTGSLTMDVAPYVDNATWRTYVPVRFAADAFGCNVGWDQEANTVIIADVDKLTEGALTGENYTVLDKFMDYYARFQAGAWAMKGSFTGSATLMSNPALTLNGALAGSAANAGAMDMTMTLNMDMAPLITTLSAMQNAAPTEEELAAARQTVDMAMKGDLKKGAVCLKYGGGMNAQLGLPEGVWLSMDMGGLPSQSGLDLGPMKSMDLSAMLKNSLACYPLDGKSQTGYAELVEVMNTLAGALSDKGFTKVRTGYETAFTTTEGGVTGTLTLTLTTNAGGAVVGYAMKADMDMAMPAEVTERFSAMGMRGPDKAAMTLNASVDAKNAAKMDMSLSLGQLFAMDMNMDCAYTKTNKAPDTALPEGATVVDFNDWMAAQTAAGGTQS